MPSQPSPNRPARCTAAVERPPTTTGTGAGGAGRIDTEDNEKNSPAWSTVLPARSGRRTARQWSNRRPRVEGSSLHARTSSGSSPPRPHPRTKTQGHTRESVAEEKGEERRGG